jgi:hypothetical protein
MNALSCRTVLIVIAFLFFYDAAHSQAPQLEGTWQGRMMVLYFNEDVRLVFISAMTA